LNYPIAQQFVDYNCVLNYLEIQIFTLASAPVLLFNSLHVTV